jgi:peptide-methionine (S)-S-oxide reductase
MTNENNHNNNLEIATLGGGGKIVAEKIWSDPIVTQILPYEEFFIAEEYHQDYFKHNPNQGYCQVVIAPKVTKFRISYTEKLKSQTPHFDK